ncbi:heterodisulfide reductase-related iron-sulfur binding cluster [Pelovirga terrestris]|uniref:4Fe-4S dicluster domain-containing protein n=1 Tax=Pelovirga terrestris TaxID=2771352 RepID=A0A8J6UKT7_9BACT|nr:heterodisulfide reductase-related iron-sulfur binding cluster [Pelovirga terrestris]MBD1399962.1 4Fe-4S dicluster domain-containing protein [Pelovirga terrestris]
MEYTREIYWNIGQSLGVLLPMYLLAIAAVAFLTYQFSRRIKVYRQGQPLDRCDQWPTRLKQAIRGTLLQSRVLYQRLPGTAHALFFWGFLLLFIGTLLIFIQADLTDPLFDVRFLTGPFYLWFSLILDLAGLVAIVMLAGLLIRRTLIRPPGLDNIKDDWIIHGLLLAILISGFIIEGARMAVTELGTPLALWSPVGLLVANSLAGFEEATLRSLHQVTWWGHLLLAILFIAIIPLTKLRHLFTTSTNYFFADLGPKGMLAAIDLENEETESYGAATITDLTWKDIFDADACTSCKRCQDRCPAWATDKPLSPMKLVKQVGEIAFQQPQANLPETLERDVIWSCTTCLACQESCPAAIEHVGKIVDVRRHLVLMEGEFPGDEVTAAMEQTEVNGNPFGLAFAGRGDWAQGLALVDANTENTDILYFVGCYASFDKRNQAVAKAFVTLCAAAGIKVAILGKTEKCCGEPMRKMGNEYLYQTLARENIENIAATSAQQIVTTCPHCYNTLNKDYREFGLTLPVQHYTDFLADLIKGGQLQLQPQETRCTYHDSCYLGRHNDRYQAPRSLLTAAGAQLSEMDKHGRESFCCGAGGGRILADETIGSRISEVRAEMAAATGTGTLVSSCPFCLTMFEDGIKGADLSDQLTPLDLAELLVKRLPAA